MEKTRTKIQTPIYRVVNADGWTVAEYLVHVARNELSIRGTAINHAARIGGKVFLADEYGYITAIFGWGRLND